MKDNGLWKSIVALVVVCSLLAGSSHLSFASEMQTVQYPLLMSIAAKSDWYLENLCFDAQPGQAVLDAALAAVSACPQCLIPNISDRTYDFPALEVEHRGLQWRSALVGNQYIITFFPERIPQMAACTVVNTDLTVEELFPASTWLMQEQWEQILKCPAFCWDIPTRYLFRMLFEPVEMWSAAALPEASALTEAEVATKANEALISETGSSAEQLLGYQAIIQYNLTKRYDEKGKGIWTVLYYQPVHGEEILQYSVDVDGSNGQILEIGFSSARNG